MLFSGSTIRYILIIALLACDLPSPSVALSGPWDRTIDAADALQQVLYAAYRNAIQKHIPKGSQYILKPGQVKSPGPSSSSHQRNAHHDTHPSAPDYEGSYDYHRQAAMSIKHLNSISDHLVSAVMGPYILTLKRYIDPSVIPDSPENELSENFFDDIGRDLTRLSPGNIAPDATQATKITLLCDLLGNFMYLHAHLYHLLPGSPDSTLHKVRFLMLNSMSMIAKYFPSFNPAMAGFSSEDINHISRLHTYAMTQDVQGGSLDYADPIVTQALTPCRKLRGYRNFPRIMTTFLSYSVVDTCEYILELLPDSFLGSMDRTFRPVSQGPVNAVRYIRYLYLSVAIYHTIDAEGDRMHLRHPHRPPTPHKAPFHVARAIAKLKYMPGIPQSIISSFMDLASYTIGKVSLPDLIVRLVPLALSPREDEKRLTPIPIAIPRDVFTAASSTQEGQDVITSLAFIEDKNMAKYKKQKRAVTKRQHRFVVQNRRKHAQRKRLSIVPEDRTNIRILLNNAKFLSPFSMLPCTKDKESS